MAQSAKHYETVIIFSPLLADDDVRRETAKLKKLLTDHECTIVEERYWGLRQLAYQIDGKSNGIYVIIEFQGPGHVVQKLETEYKRNENILRWLTTALDKYGIEYNEKRRKGLVGKKKTQDATPSTNPASSIVTTSAHE
ncbi:MAG: 30S ribosomal protein S6 [Chitinophagales bacterium]|nr:30S ribosomal protein S6 [Chitinophagales bacterium]MDW8427986.1 30S ribosomal protein S6 [Chitinophagales bacterium]